MSIRRTFPQAIGLGTVVLLMVGCGAFQPEPTPTPVPPTPTPAPTATPEPPDRILFVGNSHTYWNEGVDFHMEGLAGAADPPLVIEADSSIVFTAWLEILWESPEPRETIRDGDYDVVVLQGDIPMTDVDTFHEYARKFVAEIRQAEAEPVLFMAWTAEFSADRGLSWITMEEIAQAHRDIAAELGVDVAPVGLAWQRATEERPELCLYIDDFVHPSIYGTYLAANVVYATVFGKSPAGLAYLPPEGHYGLSNGKLVNGITEEEAAFLQRMAWETVQEYEAQQ